MRLFWLTTPMPLEAAVGAFRGRFGLPAGLSALPAFSWLASPIATMQVYDQGVYLKYSAQAMRAQVTGQGIKP